MLRLRTGVPELDLEHDAIDGLVRELQASASVEVLKKLLVLWRQHSEHEEELFEKTDFGRHRGGAGGGVAATASHCEHHRLIAAKMEQAVRETSSAAALVASDAIAFLSAEIKRHVEIYDAAYAGKLNADASACCQCSGA